MERKENSVIGQRLRQLRKERKLTIPQLAEATGLSASAISNYEYGFRKPNAKALVAFETYFSVSGSYLRGESDEPEPRAWERPDALEQLKTEYVFLFQQLSDNSSSSSAETQRYIADALEHINKLLRSDNEVYKVQGARLFCACFLNVDNFMAGCRTKFGTDFEPSSARGLAVGLISDAFKDFGEHYFPNCKNKERTLSKSQGLSKDRIEYYSK